MAFAAAVPYIVMGIQALAQYMGSKKQADAVNNASQASQPYYNQLASLTRQQQQQMTEADPVRRALVQLAYKNLPTYARAGIAAPAFGGTTPTYFEGTRPTGGAGSEGRAVRREAY